MKWQWKIGRFAGIDVYMHASFLLIVALVVWLHRAEGPARIVEGVLFVLSIFGCVVLHEYGHALTARRFGIRTRDITLYPIGGVARLERMPDQPMQELWVALAGPAVNVVIAIGLFGWLTFSRSSILLGEIGLTTGPFLERLMVTNLVLVVFNLLPAFPMDGGRVLRALLAMRMAPVRATRIAAGIGQGMAVVFGLLGIFGNPMLIFIALFVWIGASQEARAAQMKSALDGVPVTSAMVTDFRTLEPGDPIARAVTLVLQGSQQDFPVVENGLVAGMLTREDLIRALTEQSPGMPVGAIMSRSFPQAGPIEMLESLLARLSESPCRTVPVVHYGVVVGLVTMENVTEFLMIREAVKERATPYLRPPPLPLRVAG